MRRWMRVVLCCLLLTLPVKALSEDASLRAQPGQVAPYQTRFELMVQAADHLGVTTPEQAARLWVKGLEHRSAAMQYVMMTKQLKQRYAQQLDDLNSNWVTGMSSPWVDGFSITSVQEIGDDTVEIELDVRTLTSYSPEETYKARLKLVQEDGFWRISEIWNDPELYPYTFYQA